MESPPDAAKYSFDAGRRRGDASGRHTVAGELAYPERPTGRVSRSLQDHLVQTVEDGRAEVLGCVGERIGHCSPCCNRVERTCGGGDRFGGCGRTTEEVGAGRDHECLFGGDRRWVVRAGGRGNRHGRAHEQDDPDHHQEEMSARRWHSHGRSSERNWAMGSLIRHRNDPKKARCRSGWSMVHGRERVGRLGSAAPTMATCRALQTPTRLPGPDEPISDDEAEIHRRSG